MENNLKINVLDHGFVRLVSYMQPADPSAIQNGYWNGDLEVVRNARVSYNAAWRAGEDEKGDERLIKYLWKNRHTTPFESMAFTFEVKAPIFVFRQWHRHRTWSYNELSARYKELPEEFYVPLPEMIGKQSAISKQARDIAGDDLLGKNKAAARMIKGHCERAFNTYKVLLSEGVPRELARTVLPLGTYSQMFGTVNLLNLLKFLTLRDHDHAQHEIRVYAIAMLKLTRPIVPVTAAAWEDKTNG